MPPNQWDPSLHTVGSLFGVEFAGERLLAVADSYDDVGWVGRVVGSQYPGLQIGKTLKAWKRGLLPKSDYDGLKCVVPYKVDAENRVCWEIEFIYD